MVRNWQGGLEVFIVDEEGNLLLSHKSNQLLNIIISGASLISTVECGQQDIVFPYTWHSEFWDHQQPLEVTFKGTAVTCHTVFLNDSNSSTCIPKYILAKKGDLDEFQGQVSGKTLAGTFEVHRITSATSVVHKSVGHKKKTAPDAKDEHLKCWKSERTQRYSISYFANNLVVNNKASPRFLEFPLASLNYYIGASNEAELKHRFNISEKAFEPPKKSRTLSWALSSRSPTLVEGSPSSTTLSKLAVRVCNAVDQDYEVLQDTAV